MAENIFLARQEPAQLKDYLQFTGGSRGNLGDEVPVSVYRMLEYSLKEELRQHRNSRHPPAPHRRGGPPPGRYQDVPAEAEPSGRLCREAVR